MVLDPAILWMALLSTLLGVCGWVINNLKQDVEKQRDDFVRFINELPKQYISASSYEVTSNRLEAAVLRIESKLDTKLENLAVLVAQKADRKDLEALRHELQNK
jgi:hypothetical protein